MPHEPRHHQLRVGINRGEGPDVALARVLGLPLLRAHERPDLVRLDPLAGQIPEPDVLITRAELPDFYPAA